VILLIVLPCILGQRWWQSCPSCCIWWWTFSYRSAT